MRSTHVFHASCWSGLLVLGLRSESSRSLAEQLTHSLTRQHGRLLVARVHGIRRNQKG